MPCALNHRRLQGDDVFKPNGYLSLMEYRQLTLRRTERLAAATFPDGKGLDVLDSVHGKMHMYGLLLVKAQQHRATQQCRQDHICSNSNICEQQQSSQQGMASVHCYRQGASST
jgi:hypothetical protein